MLHFAILRSFRSHIEGCMTTSSPHEIQFITQCKRASALCRDECLTNIGVTQIQIFFASELRAKAHPGWHDRILSPGPSSRPHYVILHFAFVLRHRAFGVLRTSDRLLRIFVSEDIINMVYNISCFAFFCLFRTVSESEPDWAVER